tara:strand:- start:20280 stop:21623 length:1344 start_codon:yes stop_codon:yes gene_type:complete
MNQHHLSTKPLTLAFLLILFLGSGEAARAQGVWGDPVDSGRVDTLEFLVILPFGLQVDTVAGGALPRRAQRLREIALEHLHGVELAVGQLAEAGVPVHLEVVDEVVDSLGNLQFSNLQIARADIVIGPLMRENLGVAAPKVDRFGREHVLLTEQPQRYVERGGAVRQAVASEWAMTEQLAEWVSTAHDTDHVMLVVTGGSDLALEAHFEAQFNAAQRAKWMLEGDSLKFAVIDTVTASSSSVGRLADHVTPYARNVIVSVAGRSSRSMWAALQTELQMNDSSAFVLFGHPELAEMPFVEGGLMSQWRVTLPLFGQVQWGDSSLRATLEKYRALTGSEPGKYARLAHDAVLDAGIRRHPHIRDWVQPLLTPLIWDQREEGGAWHNETWTLHRFQDLAWARLDTLPPLAPFVPRLFWDPETEEVIPVPEAYRNLFPDTYAPDGTLRDSE